MKEDDCISEIGVNQNMEVHILNVATTLAKKKTKEVQGPQFSELSDSHPVQMELNRLSSMEDVTTNLNEFYMHRAGIIMHAVQRFRQRRRIHPSSPAAETETMA